MKNIWEYDWFFVPVAMFFGFCGVLAMIVPYSRELLFFNELRFEPFNSIFHFFTLCGEFWAYLVFGVAVYLIKPRFTIILAIVGLLAIPVGYIVKDVIGVDRPITYLEKRAALAQVVLVPDTDLNRGQTSFPSGHTMAAFALYSLLSLMVGQKYERFGLAFALIAILVGVSRIFLVQHFLIDVLAGAFLGLVLSGVIWWLAERFFSPDQRKNP
jgi:membrane-associated phospholipid phosphatase